MSPFRILILSSVRPSRAWRMANRITREVPGAEICGIVQRPVQQLPLDRKSTRLNSSHGSISYAVFCLQKNNTARFGTRLGCSEAGGGAATFGRHAKMADSCAAELAQAR